MSELISLILNSKQAEAELCQAQVNLGLPVSSLSLLFILFLHKIFYSIFHLKKNQSSSI
jgi:hypothetical protein